jgi:hypothetical protein
MLVIILVYGISLATLLVLQLFSVVGLVLECSLA